MSHVLKVFFISVGLCFCFAVHAETTVAKVAWVKGTFRATSNTGTRALTKGSSVYLHDTLITGKGSTAQIVFTDDTLMVFRANSNLYVSDYRYEPKKNNVGHYVMNLITGGFRTVTGWIARNNPEHYQIKTPVAVIGVRGTNFSVLFNQKLFVGRYSGAPTITSAGQTIVLSASTAY